MISINTPTHQHTNTRTHEHTNTMNTLHPTYCTANRVITYRNKKTARASRKLRRALQRSNRSSIVPVIGQGVATESLRDLGHYDGHIPMMIITDHDTGVIEHRIPNPERPLTVNKVRGMSAERLWAIMKADSPPKVTVV